MKIIKSASPKKMQAAEKFDVLHSLGKPGTFMVSHGHREIKLCILKLEENPRLKLLIPYRLINALQSYQHLKFDKKLSFPIILDNPVFEKFTK